MLQVSAWLEEPRGTDQSAERVCLQTRVTHSRRAVMEVVNIMSRIKHPISPSLWSRHGFAAVY